MTTTFDLGPIGVALPLTPDGSHLSDAKELERLGYDTIWLAGGQLQSLDPVADLVGVTTTMRIGTGIISLDVHDDETVRGLYGDLERTAPGRFVVGLGAPQSAPSPLRAMNDFLDRIDASENPIPRQRRILAALGPKKLELARERFAGAITLLVTPDHTARAREILGPDRALIVDQMMVLDDDPVRARAAAREPLRFLLGNVRGYRLNARRMGFSDNEIADLDDRLVDELVVWGDADTLATRVLAQQRAGADQVSLSFLGVEDDLVDNARALAERLIEAQN